MPPPPPGCSSWITPPTPTTISASKPSSPSGSPGCRTTNRISIAGTPTSPPEDPTNAWLIDQGPYRGWTRPEILRARYERCKAAAAGISVFVNFAGTQVTPVAYTHGAGHKPYIDSADWLGHDWYVGNRNAQRYPIDFIGLAIDKLAQWSATPENPAGKPQLAFIECSNQGISSLGRCPTPDEIEAEVNLALSKGARGIIYFPQRIAPGFSFDAIPAENEARMIQINRRVAQLSPAVPSDHYLERLATICGRLEAMADKFQRIAEKGIHLSADLHWVDA